MARTHDFTEVIVDWVSGQFRQARFANMWLGGGAGAEGGSSYRPIDGQLTQRHVCYDTTETASPCSPSGFSSLVDNLRRIRYWQEPATWFGVIPSGTIPSGADLNVYIKPGLWYPSTTEYCAFAGGNSPTFTCPGALDRIDTVYIDASGILHIQQGTPAASPTITLPPIASGIPLWAVYLPPTASGIYFQTCSGYYAGQGYIERDLRPFLNLGGGVAASGIPNATAEGQAIISNALNEWTADITPRWKGEHSFEAGIAFVGATIENSITIPDAQTQAFHIIDTGGTTFLHLDTTANNYFLIDPAGVGIKVGIGTSTPAYPLDVLSSAGNASRLVESGAATNNVQNVQLVKALTSADMVDGFGPGFVFQIEDNAAVNNNIGVFNFIRDGADNSGKFQVTTANAGAFNVGLVMDHLGNVGIGTIGPLAPLDVRGKTLLQSWLHINNSAFVNAGGGDARAAVVFGATDDEEAWFLGAYSDTTKANTVFGLFSWALSGWAQVWLPDGKVGIGTTGPVYMVDIEGNPGAGQPLLRLETTGATDEASIRYERVGAKVWTAGVNTNNDFFFYDAIGGATRLVIQDTTGNVGIGTPNPDNKLDVEGSIRINDNKLYLRTGVDTNHYIGFTAVVDGPRIAGYSGIEFYKTNGGVQLGTWDSGKLYVNTKVGIGRTNPYGPLHGYGSYGGFIFFEATSIVAGEVTIIPNGAGDVVYMLQYHSIIHCTQDQCDSGCLETPGAGNVEVNIYTDVDVPANIFTLRLYSTGQVTIRRGAGTALGRCAIWLTWL